DLKPLVSYNSQWRVSDIDQQDHLDRGIFFPGPYGAIHFLERTYRLRFLVIEECEILLREPGNRTPGSIRHHHIELDSVLRLALAGWRAMREFRTALIPLRGRRGALLGDA